MRIGKNRFKVKKLFVLGAGASYAATRPNAKFSSEKPPQKQTPLDKHFSSVLSELIVKKNEWVNYSAKEIVKTWKDHTPFDQCGLEEAILMHEANVKFINNITVRKKKKQIQFENYMNHLVHLIAFYLKRAREGKEKTYNKFANLFFKSEGTKNRVITFNYDDVFDKILLQRNYNVKNVYSQRIRSSENGNSKFPLIVKLHGSVNWNCKSKDCLRIISHDWENKEQNSPNVENANLFDLDVWYREKGCPSTSSDESPCIIPPIGSKPITEIGLFRDLWTTACEYLYECEELYVCGYSLPQADTLATTLFKQFKNNKLEKITVIDPDPSIIKKWRQLLSRRDVNSAQWSYSPDFSEFVSNYK